MDCIHNTQIVYTVTYISKSYFYAEIRKFPDLLCPKHLIETINELIFIAHFANIGK